MVACLNRAMLGSTNKLRWGEASRAYRTMDAHVGKWLCRNHNVRTGKSVR